MTKHFNEEKKQIQSNEKAICLLVINLVNYVSTAQEVGRITDPVDWVNPLMGTESNYDLSNGNTYPAIAVPWGMNFWTQYWRKYCSQGNESWLCLCLAKQEDKKPLLTSMF